MSDAWQKAWDAPCGSTSEEGTIISQLLRAKVDGFFFYTWEYNFPDILYTKAGMEVRQLENQGVEILACGTCLSRFQLTEKVAVAKCLTCLT